ncbi:MAG TPA: SAM-dependent methyltransferase, partial [Methylocella sp.]|nr:SAM-dependent methyltransferase [Methylocella sp.]
PWIFGIGNLVELAAREGMAVVEDHNTASLYRAYRPGGTLDSPLFCCYSLCTLAPARCLTR